MSSIFIWREVVMVNSDAHQQRFHLKNDPDNDFLSHLEEITQSFIVKSILFEAEKPTPSESQVVDLLVHHT